jgi:hypothetical protein
MVEQASSQLSFQGGSDNPSLALSASGVDPNSYTLETYLALVNQMHLASSVNFDP